MNKRVLLVQYSAKLDGSAISGLMLVDGLQEAGWETHVAFGFEGPIIDRYRTASHHTHVVGHKSWLRTHRPLNFVRNLVRERPAVKAFEAVLADVQPDLVYINTCVSLAGALAAHWQKIPCVWHLRELFSDVGGEMKAPFGSKPLIRASFRKYARRIVANSTAVAENIMGATAQHIDIIPNAVDTTFFEHRAPSAAARRMFGLPEQGPVLGVPGTLRPMKGHPFLFRALQQVAQDEAPLTVAVTGGGEPAYVQELKTMAHDLGLASMVRFLGYIDDMPSFFRACDLVCIPSVAEPFGRTVIEAFATETPVIATAVGGIKETIDHGQTGLLVPYGDIQALVEGIRRVLKDPDLRNALCRNAFHKARSEYEESIYKSRICRIVAETSGQLSHTPDGYAA